MFIEKPSPSYFASSRFI
jgi:hypothetical protein